MTGIVYADILFVTNMVITYLLIRLVAAVFSAKKSIVRLALASAIGGVFSFYILVPEQNFLINLIIKLSFSSVIILTAFKMRSAKQFFKLMLCFYAVSFAFAGIMIAAWIIIKPQGMLINNSVVYFNISVPVLLVSSAFCYGVIWLVQRVLSKRMPRDSACDVSVTVDRKTVMCRAMIDTGNNLSDLFTGFPVIVADYSSVESLIPYEYRAFYSKTGDLPKGLDSFSQRVRTIPYQVVGGDGLLPSFKPDYIMLRINGRKIRVENVIVSVTSRGMAQADCEVLLNSSMSEYY